MTERTFQAEEKLLSPRSLAVLKSMLGRMVRLNLVGGGVHLAGEIDARGVVLEHWAPAFPIAKRRSAFCYLAAPLGREHQLAWGVRRATVLPRLPIGLHGRLYARNPVHGSFMNRTGMELLTGERFQPLVEIRVFSETCSFETEFPDGGETPGHGLVGADRRIEFVFEGGTTVAFETGDCDENAILVAKVGGCPADRRGPRLRLRLSLAQDSGSGAVHPRTAGLNAIGFLFLPLQGRERCEFVDRTPMAELPC